MSCELSGGRMSLFHSYVARDVVEVEPVYFPERVAEAGAETDAERQRYQLTFDDILVHRLTERYVGRVVPGLGLCVAIHDIVQYAHGAVRGPSASAWLTAQFRLCVFAPTPGARLRATISAQTREGIHLTLDFFHFLFFVPGDLLIQPSFYHEKKKCWVLQVEGDEEDDASGPTLNSYENGDEVVVKVEQVTVRDLVDFHGGVAAKSGGGVAEGSAATKLPMEIRGSFLGTGLGPVLWFET